jgi:hypothetical protein
MKNRRILTALVLVLALSAGSGATLLVMNSCDAGGGTDDIAADDDTDDVADDGGGTGADFDATLYYTKTEVDGLVDGVFQGFPQDSYQPLTGVDFAGRAATGWVVPAGVTAGFFEVNVYASGAASGPVNIIISTATNSDAPDTGFTPSTGCYSTALFMAPSLTAGSTVYAWHTTGHSGAPNLTNLQVAVRCRGWIR